ncbi:unnamed protein product [Lepeophtheirus salmonis]|uniref:(salmon louse) hypothetical protein n=1 Tax=Lepeophtheirus salmonis TaxID=72036 RepID=A0A7R8H2S6_LEPSM|nr:unnamed protein product [Lepeophtheirus salmonis]CAF2833371.1 unnamed protein product [Lepeophtheirus salmonis]
MDKELLLIISRMLFSYKMDTNISHPSNRSFHSLKNSQELICSHGGNGTFCHEKLGDAPSLGGYGAILDRQTWVIPMMALAAINVIAILGFEIYVVTKASRHTPSRRHLFLGQMLLLGLLLGSSVGFAYAAEPNDFACSVIRMGTGLSYGLIYSSLLVKLVFLISLNTGVYLPASYQALLFLFCLLVQIVIGVQWIGTYSTNLCTYSTQGHILSLLDNYREAKYIGILMAISLPLWITWVVASLLLNESFQSVCEGFGLLVICSITFIVMFLPKSRQLSAIGKEGIYIEDQLTHPDDRFSLQSGNTDPYAPSFYHFKPFYGAKFPFNGGIVSPRTSSAFKDHGSESPLYRSGNSYTGFHRPLRVVPPSATPTNSNQQGPPGSSRCRDRRSSSYSPPPPPTYNAQTPYFPSHFSPEKLNQYWQFYHPRLPGMYVRSSLDPDTYASIYDQERFKSTNPNVYFYKTSSIHHNHHRHPGFIY